MFEALLCRQSPAACGEKPEVHDFKLRHNDHRHQRHLHCCCPAIQIQIQMNSANSARSCWSGYIGNQRIRASRNEFVCLNNLKSELESAKLRSCELDCWKIWTFLPTSWELGRSLQYFYTGTKQQQPAHVTSQHPPAAWRENKQDSSF